MRYCQGYRMMYTYGKLGDHKYCLTVILNTLVYSLYKIFGKITIQTLKINVLIR